MSWIDVELTAARRCRRGLQEWFVKPKVHVPWLYISIERLGQRKNTLFFPMCCTKALWRILRSVMAQCICRMRSHGQTLSMCVHACMRKRGRERENSENNTAVQFIERTSISKRVVAKHARQQSTVLALLCRRGCNVMGQKHFGLAD